MAFRQKIRWVSAAATSVGKVRKLNEDAFLDESERGSWAVADGMGGHDAGDYASRVVVDALSDLPEAKSIGARVDVVTGLIDTANRDLLEVARERQARIVGTTLVALVTRARQAAVIWAGDSRAYRLRGGKLRQLTRDHSRIQTLIEQGRIQPGRRRESPRSERDHPRGGGFRAAGARCGDLRDSRRRHVSALQ